MTDAAFPAQPVAVIAGAGGFVGPALIRAFEDDGYRVRIIGRSGPDARWDDPAAVRGVVEGADVLVNLAGKSVNCRYTDVNRDEIYRSRIDTTRMLRQAVTDAASPPRVWLNASTATIYRYAMDRPQIESTGELGSGFSVDVARNWERELFEGHLPDTRRVALRMAIVLGRGPATDILFRLARWGLGGTQHDSWWPRHRRYRGIGPSPTESDALWHRSRGHQRFSWIHIDDVVGAARFIRDHEQIDGVVNLAAPHPSDNRELMRTLRRTVGVPTGAPSWRLMLEPAMWLLRTEAELVLKSRWVLPDVLTAAGYPFVHSDLEPALQAIWAARDEERSGAAGP